MPCESDNLHATRRSSEDPLGDALRAGAAKTQDAGLAAWAKALAEGENASGTAHTPRADPRRRVHAGGRG